MGSFTPTMTNLFLQKSVHTLGLSVDFQVRQIGLLKYFGNTSLYIKARGTSLRIVVLSLIDSQ